MTMRRLVIAVALVFASGCGTQSSTSTDGQVSTSVSASATPSATLPPDTRPPLSAMASVVSSARASDPIAALFEQVVPVSGATPTAIYEGINAPRGSTLRQSGLVLDLAPEFYANRTSMGPAGLDAWVDPTPKKVRAMLTLSVVRGAPLDSKRVDSECGALLFRAERWSDPTTLSRPAGARVWRGSGSGMSGERWSAYVVDAPFDDRQVRGCIGWRDGAP